MAVQQPQYDNNISGGSDTWDNGLAGEIITADYFDAAPPPSGSGNIKVWLGSWLAKPVKVWNGSSWVVKPVKFWNGSSWVTTGY